MAEAMAALKAQAVGEWEAVGDCFFARESLYDMAWDDIDPQDMRLAFAPYGGPIAAIRDERRMVLVPSGTAMAAAGGALRPVLRTYTCSGVALGAAVWEGTGRIVDWGWTEELQLLVVEASGRVSVFNAFAEKLREFSFGLAVERDGVALARVYGTGVVVLTEPQQFPVAAAPSASGTGVSGGGGGGAVVAPGAVWAVTDLRDPRPYRMAAIPAAAASAAAATAAGAAAAAAAQRPGVPQALAVLDPRHTLSTGLEVLAAVGGVLWQVDDRTAADHHPGPLRAAGGCAPGLLAPSPDGAFVALYTRGHKLVVLAADLSRQLTEFEAQGVEQHPSGLHWVGSDAVLLTWEDGTALLVGPYGDHVELTLGDDVTAVVAELDGCRLLLGRSRHELLRRVPECVVQVFRPGATGPAAQLWDARALYEEQSPKCDRILREIQAASPDSLPLAVRTCLEAAGADLAPPRQRALFRCAALGRPFCPPSFPRQLMYGVACRLRVLNAVRDPRVGLPLTMTQLEALSLPVLVARLIAYRQWLLAYRIAGVLKNIPGAAPPTNAAASGGAAGTALAPAAVAASVISQDAVLVQWACAKISASVAAAAMDDAQLKDAIVAKLKGSPHVRYAPLAAHALSVGRRRLALRLLEEERSAAQQVPLLLSLAVGGRQQQQQQQARNGGRQAPEEEAEGDTDDDVLQRALRKAVESGDTDLVYLVLFGLYRARPLAQFWSMVASRTLARNLFIKYCRAKEPELLETILTTAASAGAPATAGAAGSSGASASAAAASSSPAAALAAAAAAAFPPSAATAELASLQLRTALSAYCTAYDAGTANEAANGKLAAALGDVAAKYGQTKECAFQARAAAEAAALRSRQERLERETGQRLFVGRSLADTLREAIRLGHHRAAAALKKQFAVTDRRFTWIKVLTLAEARDWEALEAYAIELRRSPIGWEPFLEAARKNEASLDYRQRLVSRMTDNNLPKAAEVAAKARDVPLFARLKAAAPANTPAIAAALEALEQRYADCLVGGGGE